MDDFLTTWDQDFNDANVDRKQLYDRLLEKFNQDGTSNVEQCWRLVKICLVISDSFLKNGKKSESKKYEEKAFEYAKKAIELDPKSMNAHKWFCAAIGRMAPHVSTKERIQYGHQFKEHRDIAVSIDSNDMLMHHMYGRWCWEVASLSFFERKIAETFFATPPKATYDDAIDSLKLADNLKHEWKMNHLWMAKVYVSMKKYDLAIQWIDSGLSYPVMNEEDAVSHMELETLEKSYGKYRAKK